MKTQHRILKKAIVSIAIVVSFASLAGPQTKERKQDQNKTTTTQAVTTADTAKKNTVTTLPPRKKINLDNIESDVLKQQEKKLAETDKKLKQSERDLKDAEFIFEKLGIKKD